MKLEELRKPETTINWSKHKLKITTNKNVLIHDLKIHNSMQDRVTFINSMGICAVTGDYGNWIFCREFHPSKEGYVSRAYWSEKLKIGSTQQSGAFDSDFAISKIDAYLNDEEYEWEEEEKEYLENLKNSAEDGEYAYNAAAMDYPGNFDSEMIPTGLKRRYWLSAVYDAFNEICTRTRK